MHKSTFLKILIIGILTIGSSSLFGDYLKMVKNFKVSDGDFSSKVHVSFDALEGANLYNLRMYDVSCDADILVGLAGACARPIKQMLSKETNFYIDLEPSLIGKQLYFAVQGQQAVPNKRATDISLEHAYDMGFAQGKPSVPLKLTATDGKFNNENIGIKFKPVKTVSSYEIYRKEKESSNNFKVIQTISNPSLKHWLDKVDTQDPNSIQYGLKYLYKIKACNNFGCSDFSNEDSGALRPPVPKLACYSGDKNFSDRNVLELDYIKDARYEIQRSLTEDLTCKFIINTRDSVFQDVNVNENTSYYYRARTCFDSLNGPYKCSFWSRKKVCATK